jgi:hypothetical protein
MKLDLVGNLAALLAEPSENSTAMPVVAVAAATFTEHRSRSRHANEINNLVNFGHADILPRGKPCSDSHHSARGFSKCVRDGTQKNKRGPSDEHPGHGEGAMGHRARRIEATLRGLAALDHKHF